MKPYLHSIFPLRPLAFVTLSVSFTAKLMADNIYWDGPTGSSWNVPANWSTVPGDATPNPVAPPSSGDVIHFSIAGQTTARTVNLMTNQAVQGIATENLTGTVTLRGGGAAPVDLTIGADGISHTRGGLTIGNATADDKVNVTLGASQTWNSSTESTGASGIMLHNDLSATGDHTLTLTGINTGSHISGAISDGSGKLSLIKEGEGTWELRGANTYTGTTQVNEGILRVTNAAAASLGTAITVADGATFSLRIGSNGLSATEADTLRARINYQSSAAFLGLDSTANFTYANNISGNHGLMKTGNQTLTLSGNNTYTGDTVIANGLIAYTRPEAIANIDKIYAKSGAGIYALADGFTLTELEELRNSTHYEDNTAFFGISTQNGNFSYDIAMAGEHSFVKAGSNTLTFGGSGSNTYTGVTRVATGTLLLNKTDGATAIAGNVLLTGGSLSLGADNQIADTSVITASGGSISLLAKNETVAGLSLSGTSTLSTGNSNSTPTTIVNLGTVTLADTSRITINSGGRIVADSLSLAGTIDTNNTSGNILIGTNHTLGASELEIGAGGLTMQNRTIQINGTTTATQQGARISLNGTFTGSGENLFRINGANNRLAELSMGTGQRMFNIIDGTTQINLSVSGESLRKDGAGILTLAGNNTYTGDTIVDSGTLNVTTGGALNGGGSVAVANGATFSLLGTYLFNIGGNGESNSITGAGTKDLTGIFNLNLTSAVIADGNEWSLVGGSGTVNWDGLQITSTSGAFSKAGDVWSLFDGENTWSFDQNTGSLTLTIPEPGQVALLLFGLGCSVLRRRRN